MVELLLNDGVDGFMALSDYERLLTVFAEGVQSTISSLPQLVSDEYEWLESDKEARLLESRFVGTFIASIVGEIEERVGKKFSSIIDQLSDRETSRRSEYWFQNMPITSTLRGRAKVIWAIRVAYTHGNGHISRISKKCVARALEAEFVDRHFNGVRVEDGVVCLSSQVIFPALRTSLEINDKFGG